MKFRHPLRLKFGLLLFIGLMISSTLEASKVRHVMAVARPGDGVLSLLRLYQLEKMQCNVDHFYKVNNLKKDQGLVVNQAYKMPLYYYEYNGKSIRSTIGNNNWDKAVRIQNYNREMVKAKLQAREYEQSKALWVPHHELECEAPANLINESPEKDKKDEIIAIPVGFKENLIFGKDYAKVPIVSSKLKGQVYYIVAGHGGPDPGAVGKRGGKLLCEDEYAYDVSLRLTRNLISHGASAYMIIRDPNDGIRSGQILDCDYDEECWGGKKIPRNTKAKLTQRAETVNGLYNYHKKKGVPDANQKMICIHVDSRTGNEKIDMFFYHFPGNEAGKKLANTLRQTIKEKYKQYQPNRGYTGTVTPRDLHMTREVKPTSVYVELANIKNNFDLKRIIIEQNRQAIADWLLQGLIKAKG